MTKGFVYIVTYASLKWRTSHPVIKIGKAVDIGKRIADLSTASPINLVLVASIQSDNARKLEGHLHKTFAKHRLNGEWFELNLDMIRALRNHYLISDKFDELFDFSRSSEQIEIDALKSQISELNRIHARDQKTISDLESRLELYMPIPAEVKSEKQKERDIYRFVRSYNQYK